MKLIFATSSESGQPKLRQEDSIAPRIGRNAVRTAPRAASNSLERCSGRKPERSPTAREARSHIGPASLSTAIRTVASARRTTASRPSACSELSRAPRPLARSSSSMRPPRADRSPAAFAPARASSSRRTASRLRTARRSASAFASSRRKRCSAACRERTPRLAAISCQLDPDSRARAMSRCSTRSSSVRSAPIDVNASLTLCREVGASRRTAIVRRHSSATSEENPLTPEASQPKTGSSIFR